jgi:hypothetical protein
MRWDGNHTSEHLLVSDNTITFLRSIAYPILRLHNRRIKYRGNTLLTTTATMRDSIHLFVWSYPPNDE